MNALEFGLLSSYVKNYTQKQLDAIKRRFDIRLAKTKTEKVTFETTIRAARCAKNIKKLATKWGFKEIRIKCGGFDGTVDVYGIQGEYLFSWDFIGNHKVWDLSDPADYL